MDIKNSFYLSIDFLWIWSFTRNLCSTPFQSERLGKEGRTLWLRYNIAPAKRSGLRETGVEVCIPSKYPWFCSMLSLQIFLQIVAMYAFFTWTTFCTQVFFCSFVCLMSSTNPKKNFNTRWFWPYCFSSSFNTITQQFEFNLLGKKIIYERTVILVNLNKKAPLT